MKIRKLFTTCIIGSLAVLGGCTTLQITDAIGQIQAYTAVACKFIPTVATILAFLNAGIGTAVGTVGAAICAAVPPPATARYQALPLRGHPAASVSVVSGIPVTGWRTQ